MQVAIEWQGLIGGQGSGAVDIRKEPRGDAATQQTGLKFSSSSGTVADQQRAEVRFSSH